MFTCPKIICIEVYQWSARSSSATTLSTPGPSCSWSYGSWIYNYLWYQCLHVSPLKLWVRIPLRRGVLDTRLCDKVCQWLAAGLWFSWSTPISSTNKTDGCDITEILSKVALNTISQNNSQIHKFHMKMKYCYYRNLIKFWRHSFE